MRKVVTALVVAALLAAGPALSQAKSGKGGGYEQLNLFSEVYDRIRQDAVEPVGEGKLIGAAIAGMLSGLDARSAYISEAAYRAMQTPANDDQPSLGLVVTIENGQLKVIAPQDGSPAAHAGIKPGDLIYAIDKDPTYDLTLGEAEQKLRGPAGSEVELSLRRDNDGPIDVTAKREHYKLQTVTGRIEAGNILYLRVAGFDPATPAAITNTVENLRQQVGNRVIGFILDLRNNPGGAFEAAVAVADTFLDKGDIAVVKGRKPGSLKRISATPGDIAQGVPIVALINGGTAREAELVAAALQDNRRAVLVGTRSFGEASIESLIPLQGNGAIRLTTARFMTPSGQRIQGKGLTPDLTVMPVKLAKLPQADRLHEADLRGALKNTDPGPAGAKDPVGKAAPGSSDAMASQPAPSLATADIGSAADEQLSEAADVLRGLALVSGRAG
ncbi:MAG: S41 family peptidase [Stellaceae bacterium]